MASGQQKVNKCTVTEIVTEISAWRPIFCFSSAIRSWAIRKASDTGPAAGAATECDITAASATSDFRRGPGRSAINAAGPPRRCRSRQSNKTLRATPSSRDSAHTFSPASIRRTAASLNSWSVPGHPFPSLRELSLQFRVSV